MNTISYTPDKNQVKKTSDSLKWFYAYGADDFPRQGTSDELMNYTGPFDTERDALIALVHEMHDHIDRLEKFALELQTVDDEIFHGYALPVTHLEDGGAE